MRRAAALAAASAVLSGCGAEGVHGVASSIPANAPRPVGLPEAVSGRGDLTALVDGERVLWSRPGGRGRQLARMQRLTRFRSPRVVPVVARRGDWLAVIVPELRNGQVGWLDGRRDVRLFRTRWSLEAVVSRREVTVRHDGRVVRRFRVAVGRPSAPTPPGLYAVTDRLTARGDSGPYGCCVLALSGHQPRVPQGWGGGDLLALHATSAVETIGHPASLGCMRTTNAVMRRLVQNIPLGARYRIRP
jgi:hypothetical protein